MQVNKKAYAETLSQFNLTGSCVMFDADSNRITLTRGYLPLKETTKEMGYDSTVELVNDLNETYRALCQPRYNIVISLDTMDEVNAYLSKIGTKGVRVLKDEVEIDFPQHADSCED